MPKRTDIQPGDLVEPHSRELDPRLVHSVGTDFLTLDINGHVTPPVPKDNYIIAVTREDLAYFDEHGHYPPAEES